MKYRVTHTTKYAYSEPVPVCHNEVCLTPRDDVWQKCGSHHLLIEPKPADMNSRVDYFGNRLNSFSMLEAHRGLTISATTEIEVRENALPNAAATSPWEAVRDLLPAVRSAVGLANFQYVFDSPRVKSSSSLRDYASISFNAKRPILEAVLDLTARIYREFEYAPKTTTVNTSIDEVLANRKGVCQDFAHVEIACLRSLGLAARYVSGYLRTIPPPGKPRMVGADASHAWIAVYCGDAGWIDVDPTNNVLSNTDHITLAWGRDYDDVCPVRGVLVGGGQHTMNVSVDVEPTGE